MTAKPTLRLAPGAGLLLRRECELLFSAKASEGLLEAFHRAPPGGAIDAVTLLVEDNARDTSEFVVIDWNDGVRVVMFGVLELTSNQRSLPRMSGAGVGTWVERSLRRIDGELRIEVEGSNVVAATDLRDGVVQAGGFELSWESRSLITGQPVSHSPHADPTANVGFPNAEAPGASPVTEPSREITEPARAVSDGPSRGVDPVQLLADQLLMVLPPVDQGDRSLELAYHRPPSDIRTPDALRWLDALPDDKTIVVSDSFRQELEESTSDADGPRPGEVLASICASCMAPNRDDAAACRLCGALLPPTTGNLTPVPGPVWSLQFEDGSRVAVEGAVVLGRQPIADSADPTETMYVVIDCPKVSSRHLAVCSGDWEVTVTDLGSRNGSFVVTSGDGQIVRLEPNLPIALDVGAIVQVGSRRFTIEDGRV